MDAPLAPQFCRRALIDGGSDDETSEDRVSLALEEYAAAIDAGRPISRDELLDAYADVAAELVGCLDSLEFIRHVAPQLNDEKPAHGNNSGVPIRPLATLGDFRIVRELGRGGMGVVYEAEQLSLGRRVALKVLPFAAMLDNQQLTRFKNEARAAATLDHPHIVAIYSVGTERGVHYYAMQMVEGRSLAQVIVELRKARGEDIEPTEPGGPAPTAIHAPRSRQTLLAPEPTAPALVETKRDLHAAISTLPDFDSRDYFRWIAELGVQAAEALDHAHENGILHRDIKPANLMIDDSGKLWVTDFGLARLETDAGMTMTGDLIGTLRYMSPEQALAKRAVVDHRSDIYSLGATLYESATLRLAHPATDRHELLRQIASDDPVKPRAHDARIPHDLETIIVKAMEKNAAQRYATAQELGDDLRSYLTHQPIKAKPPTRRDQIAKWMRRHPAGLRATAVASFIVVMSCLASAIGMLKAYRSEARQHANAEADLAIACESIDRMLSRVAMDQYFHGDIEHAEIFAKDATEFYDKLLNHSDNADVRYRAAEALNQVAEIWILIDKPEQALVASRRGLELMRSLLADDPGNADYIHTRGATYVSIGRTEWGRHRVSLAEEPFRQAAADFHLLVEKYPHKILYQANLASALSNLGTLSLTFNQLNEAEENYRQAIELFDRLPQSQAEDPQIWAARASALSNWGMLRRQQGDADGSMKLLGQADALILQVLEKTPTDPVAKDFLFKQFNQLARTFLAAGQVEAAARQVENLVSTLPARLDTYHYGAEYLLKCAAAVGTSDPPQPQQAAAYLDRARALIALADTATDRTPARIDEFAWFLLTTSNESFRDPKRALEFAQVAVSEVPTRNGPWLALALAHYRLEDWAAASEALKNSIDRTPNRLGSARHWLVQALICGQQGRVDEARRLRSDADKWIARHRDDDDGVDDLLGLAAEAAELSK